MWMLRPPGVYRPQEDTWLLAEALVDAGIPSGASVLDACTGTGFLGVAAGLAGAGEVTAVDISRRAVASARINGWVRGVAVRALRTDFAGLVGRSRFDVVLSNPPYVPSPPGVPKGAARAWDAGERGRSVLDRLCTALPSLLVDRGMALIVHSELCDGDRTLDRLREGGLKAAVVARRTVPFGPVLRGRARWLRDKGLLASGQDREELVVIRADAA
ncbi:HemK2/MTQ2 family protein methyltransferase [Saccharothrix espanaensis]|uniref:Putative methyltransferase n=1 Tax=Saccharothrix espanaensis (strain ATCC 51144 / DSM 44229 / JCM 9112 / NBRC 15066 / NRRL 15764) TaxID=1179773 RepID=K0JWX0_SACES|nr:HemK2/MTQ2 family protein methyltransferase [Saccharothrix espanaensis]CCH32360.1 putative methyltransferase [Saccharothrix espanaensis DSM 44229]